MNKIEKIQKLREMEKENPDMSFAELTGLYASISALEWVLRWGSERY